MVQLIQYTNTYLRCDCFFVSVYYLVEVSAPDFNAIHVTWWDVAEEVDLLSAKLCHLM